MLKFSGEFRNAVQALPILNQQCVHLLFLDIRMPKISGLELIKTLKSPPRIILTTAYEQYAIEAFELGVIDYLVKPIRFERFLKSVTKALSFQTPTTFDKLQAARPGSDRPFLYVRENRKMVKIFLDDIVYIESLKDYVKIITTAGGVITKYSMVAMEAMLPEAAFMRVHRSFLVALDKISGFSADRLTLHHQQVPIGKIYRQLTAKRLEEYSKRKSI